MVNSVATGEGLSYTRAPTFLRRPKGRRSDCVTSRVEGSNGEGALVQQDTPKSFSNMPYLLA